MYSRNKQGPNETSKVLPQVKKAYLVLLFSSALILPKCFDRTVTSSLLDHSLRNTAVVKRCSTSYIQRMVGFMLAQACFLTHPHHHATKLMLPDRLAMVPWLL